MAFPSDNTAFIHLGPSGDTRGVREFLPGEDITTGDLDAVVTNAHRQYTCAQRACFAVPSFETTSTTYVEAARVPLERIAGRNGYTAAVDHASGDVRCTLKRVSDDATVGTAQNTTIIGTRDAPGLLSLDASSELTSVALYVLVELKASSGTATLYGGVIIEGFAST